MDRSEVLFSNLSNDQIKEVQALESKFNSSSPANDQETILIAYTNPAR